MTTILVIDDDQALVQLLTESLEIEGYSVLAGYDGPTALTLAKTHHPQLILMDVNMPLGNGVAALKKLRADPVTYDIPVIFLSGEPTGMFYPAIENVPRVTYLKKPIDLEELLSMVRHVLIMYLRLADTHN